MRELCPFTKLASFVVLASAMALGCSSKDDNAATTTGSSGGSDSSTSSGGSGSSTTTGAGGSGMSMGDAGPDAPHPVIELGTWWSGMSETQALSALIDVHKARHPNVSVVVLAFADALDERSNVINRFTDGDPPAAFQANAGSDALAWGASLQSLNASASQWSSDFPPEVLEQVTYQGNLIGVPLSLARMNVAYWNKRVLDTVQLTKKIPATAAELEVWLAEVSAAGYTHPLCFSGKDAWVSAQVLFDDIVPAIAGPEFSKGYWSGQQAADDPKIFQSLDFAKRIVSYLDPNWTDWDMSDGIFKLMARETDISAQCLVTTMGDWAGRLLVDGQYLPDVDFVATGFPSIAPVTVFQGTAFLMARGAAFQEDAFNFFDTMASEAGQTAFNEKSGALPARKLAQVPSTFDSLVKKNIADLAEGQRLAGYRAIGKPAYPFDPLSTAVRDFFQTRDSAALLSFLKDNYSQLK